MAYFLMIYSFKINNYLFLFLKNSNIFIYMENIKNKIQNESNNIHSCLKNLNSQNYKVFAKLLDETKKKILRNKIIFCGNGGSAAQAQHLACELVVRYNVDRKAIPAISLTTDTSILTATGNDYNFNKIFSRQVEAQGNSGDICILLTTSGNSKNLIEAAKIANKKKLSCYSFSGKGGGKLKKYVKNNLIIQSEITSVIQTAHLVLGHIYCQELENFLLKK